MDGSYNASKKRRRFEKERDDFWKDREVGCGSCCPESKIGKEGEDLPYRGVLPTAGYQRPASSFVPPTRGSCFIGTAEALHRLTGNEKEECDERDEWIIIKVPKKAKGKIFFADYCDGDYEDEFHWLEGPYLQHRTTVADLLEFRRAQPRISRRRGGRTEFRDDADEDGMGVHGYEIPKPISPDLLGKPLAGRDLAASPNGERILKRTKREPIASPARRRVLKEASDAVLMTNKNKKGEKSAPLHDMTCLGIDTCSARSISCVIDDFLDLQAVENDK